MMNPLILSLINQAIEKLNRSELDGAQSVLEKILQIDRNNPPALQMLGLISANQGKIKDAIHFLQKAIKYNPNDPSLTYNLAKALSEAGKDAEALEYHQRTTALAPSNFNGWLNYSKSLANLEKFSLALSAIEKALLVEPNNANALSNKGAILKGLNKLDEAIQAYEHALQINPNFIEAHYNKGIALNAKEEYLQAIGSFDKAIQLDANNYAAFNNKGIALTKELRLEEALEALNRSLEIKPRHTEALINKAIILTQLKRYDEALSILSPININTSPNVSALINQGLIYFQIQQYERALELFDWATSIQPSNVDAWVNKGLTLNELKRLEEAVIAYQTAFNIKPEYDFLAGIYLGAKMQICDWHDFDLDLQKLILLLNSGKKATPPFPLLAITDSEELHLKAAKSWIKAKHTLSSMALLPKKNPIARKIRLGYFSTDFRNHPVANLIVELFESHNKNKFELIAFSFGADDRSDIRNRIVKAFDQFIDVQKISDKEVALMARDLEIDIAIDLTGLTANARPDIFAHRAAPVQINYLGYPGTMGAEYIDYIIADRTIVPETNPFYTERVLYMPTCYQANDTSRKVSNRIFTRTEVGLPEEGFVFCSFNNNYKITPETFSTWMRILNRVDKSVLWLFEDNPTAARNLKKEAILRGVDPNRLVFARRIPLSEHLARHNLADLFLDTLPYNAHTTASDALWMGLPVLTLIGQSFAGRVAASLIRTIGIDELITTSTTAYENKAVELATNSERFNLLKTQLKNNKESSTLFNSSLFCEQIENLYLSTF